MSLVVNELYRRIKRGVRSIYYELDEMKKHDAPPSVTHSLHTLFCDLARSFLDFLCDLKDEPLASMIASPEP